MKNTIVKSTVAPTSTAERALASSVAHYATQQKNYATLSDGEKLFAKLAAVYAAPPYHLEQEMIFGFACLRIKGKVFAKVHDGHLVMKLPANRIKALIDSEQASPYELRGRLAKEWCVIETSKDIIALAEEAWIFTEKANKSKD